jgi:hypothetical protein
LRNAALRSRNGRSRNSSPSCSTRFEGGEYSRVRDLRLRNASKGLQAIRTQDDCLAVYRETPGLDPLRSRRDREQPRGSVIGIATEEPHYGAVPTDDQPIPVMLAALMPRPTGRG